MTFARVLISLFGGVFVTIVVAWACCLHSTPTAGYRMICGQQPWYFTPSRTLGPCIERSLAWGGGVQMVTCTALDNVSNGFVPDQIVLTAGWPRPALAAIAEPDPARGATVWRWSMRPAAWMPEPKFDSTGAGLPLRPMLSGFAANTLLFGAGIWLVRAGGRALVAFARTRRGRCAQCGHELAGAFTCPECGTFRGGRRRPPASLAPLPTR